MPQYFLELESANKRSRISVNNEKYKGSFPYATLKVSLKELVFNKTRKTANNSEKVRIK